MRDKEEIETQLAILKSKIDFEIKNPPADDSNKSVTKWIVNMGRLDGKRQALKWVLEEVEKVEITENVRNQNAINAKNYLNKIKNEQD